ncbi:hypothetical protein [Marinivivus vitaminiproducens]|uniref:hypothetical protein n=1 Tax=Marinivivus vitaminiproducens TaxID=3035935 RepID=UPI0027A17B2C|nr:hypothetical protein P4R82_06595 [Geminicoccaceae bacterium SCSIO 64248]
MDDFDEDFWTDEHGHLSVSVLIERPGVPVYLRLNDWDDCTSAGLALTTDEAERLIETLARAVVASKQGRQRMN